MHGIKIHFHCKLVNAVTISAAFATETHLQLSARKGHVENKRFQSTVAFSARAYLVVIGVLKLCEINYYTIVVCIPKYIG